MRKWILLTLGVLSVVLATAGIILPLLPTTPFLLLAAACFFHSSDRLYSWLVNHRWFSSYIRNYREHRALPMRAKILTILLLWVTLGCTAIWFVNSLIIRILLVLIGTAVTVHILQFRTLTPEMRSCTHE